MRSTGFQLEREPYLLRASKPAWIKAGIDEFAAKRKGCCMPYRSRLLLTVLILTVKWGL
jgi:hypothetical protein